MTALSNVYIVEPALQIINKYTIHLYIRDSHMCEYNKLSRVVSAFKVKTEQ